MVPQNIRRLLNVTILNCMIIYHTDSGQSKIDHLKFRVDLVWALFAEHGSEIGNSNVHCMNTYVIWVLILSITQ